MANLSKIFFILLFLSSCSLTSTYYVDPIYEDHPHTTEVYWYTDYELGGTPYFGYWNNFYYYYGVPHFYPWWYYYQFIPPYHYYSHTHIVITINNGYYVYRHRGPKFHNIGPDCKINHGKFTPTVKLKNKNDKAFVFPRDWKSYNSTKNTKHTKDYIKKNNWWNNVSKNNIYYNKDVNKRNNNFNINKNNTINKGNNGSTRPNKTRINQKKKR